MAYRRAFPGAQRATRASVTGGGGGFTPNSGYVLTSGTFGNDQIVTITKAAGGFGTKPGGGKPRRWYPYEGSLNVDSTYSRDTSSLGTQTGCTFQTTVKPTNAAGAAKQTNFAGDTYVFTASPPFTFNTTDKFYCFVERLHDHTNNGDGSTTVKGTGTENLNLKTIRAWPVGGSAAGLPDCYMAIGSDLRAFSFEQTADGGFSPAAWCELGFGANGVSVGTEFMSCEHFFRESSGAGVSDAVFAHARDSLWTTDLTDGWNSRSGSTKHGSFYLDELTDNAQASNPGGSIYYHALYFDDSWCRVFLSDETTYKSSGSTGTRRKRAICIPTSWSDTDITFLVRKGQLASTTGMHLYIGLENGSVLDAGVGA